MQDFRMRGFQAIPTVIKNLVIINALIFLAQTTFENNSAFSIENYFALHDIRSGLFRPHQLITYMFLHGDLSHIFFNMFAVWMFGSILENYWGPKRFLTFYIACGIGAALLHLAVLYYELSPEFAKLAFYTAAEREEILINPGLQINGATLGASGSVFGCLAAFGYLFPNSLLYVYFLFPIKAKWFVLIYGGIELFLGIRNSAGDNVAHWAHLGGAAVGILFVMIWNKTNRRNFY